VVSALQNKNQHVPYRNSRLTQVLQDSMGGTAKMVMLLHISPEQASAQESLGTCAFGVRAASVERSAPVRLPFTPNRLLGPRCARFVHCPHACHDVAG